MSEGIPLQAISVERVVSRERQALLDRNFAKYSMLVGPMWAMAKLSPERGSRLEAAYYFARHIDDVLDGDRQLEDTGEGFANHILDHIEGDASSSRDIVGLFDFAIEGLEGRELERTKEQFASLVNVMEFDRKRSEQFLEDSSLVRMDRKELRDYYDASIGNPIRIALTLLESESRVEDMDGLPIAMGRLYTLRDFSDDIENGICNVPQGEEIGKNWFNQELQDASEEMHELRASSLPKLDGTGRRLLRFLSHRPSRYHKKLKYPY